jgi:tetratricopeptide (TPR) repeat protein
MPLSIGSHLGPYEILAPLGAGGMGEVFRARDTRLKREVALKILPDSLSADPERIARFQREAEVLASLNHAHIAAIYGLEESNGVRALVLELVEGETLADWIAQGAMPLVEVLPIAKQIAEALEAAQEKGIIHRDLKPSNIAVSADGQVKVLDFGLAKVVAGDRVESETGIATIGTTREGMILGTPAYMSPEQARGEAVDKRTDIWAFGCVLYELLSARSAFAGRTTADTIANILGRDADWQALPPSTPPRIVDLLRRCLAKDQQRRLHDIADARIEVDEARTALSPRRRVFELPVVATGIALALTLLAGAGWYARKSTPSVQHPPVSVLIADVENRTDDPTFDRTLEPVLKLALEGAGFITAFDRTAISRTLGVRPPDRFDEAGARRIAANQGLGVVLSASLESQGSGYSFAMKATQTVTGDIIAESQDRASTKDQVLEVATRLISRIRAALGDETSEAAQMFAMRSVSATSLEVVREYAAAVEAQSSGKYEEAQQHFSKALEREPKFGLAYLGLAGISRNLGRQEDAEKYAKEALRYLDGMTERERFNTRAFYYRLTGDYQQCVKEYGELIARYAADPLAHNQRALCSSKLRDMRAAVEEMRQVVQILPKRVLFRGNLAVYADYAGDFQMAEREALAINEPYDLATLAVAFAKLGQGLLSEAAQTYEALAMIAPRGASWAASGLGDLAVYEGRFSDAVRILEDGAAADLAATNTNRAARKFTSVAYAHLAGAQTIAAVAAAEKALIYSSTVEVRFLTARIFVEADAVARAQTLAAGLSSQLPAEPRAYGKIIEGEIALKNGDARQAITLLTDANDILDTWVGHFDLGRAYLEIGALPQADSEFDRCLQRRGEALSLLVDEEPTWGYLPAAYYYQGLVRDGLKSEGFRNSYRQYLAIRGNSREDPLLPDVRRRATEQPETD